jgi:hypothetical protein
LVHPKAPAELLEERADLTDRLIHKTRITRRLSDLVELLRLAIRPAQFVKHIAGRRDLYRSRRRARRYFRENLFSGLGDFGAYVGSMDMVRAVTLHRHPA